MRTIDSKTFEKYENEMGTAVEEIAKETSEANGLTNVRGELMLNVVLVAHKCKFDAPILINSVKKITMTDDFEYVVVDFPDTLPLIKSVTNRKKKGECTLTGLASWLQISTESAHNAVNDALMLVKIIQNLKIKTKQLIDRSITWTDKIASVCNAEKSATQLKTLDKLGTCISSDIKKNC
ncbi:hypothetical protein KQX54_012878 [Cotesia glomerata]|uniref:Gfd2/YDR514C-like C-terminal domain-containing protein n=1 Tax=Cotesia glomerata TaxID=32391 RepID=A0AAV7IKA7_COTGL|nr:hypothetical protein KQX54_012878 [Cotesia glomerata]